MTATRGPLTDEQRDLAARLWPRLRGFALKVWSRRGLDEDTLLGLASMALVQAVGDPSRRPDADPWSYTTRRLEWRVLEELRRSRRRRALSLDEIGDVAADPPKDPAATPVASLLDVLSPRRRELVERHYLGREKHAAIAASLGIGHGAARRSCSRAVATLRGRFARA